MAEKVQVILLGVQPYNFKNDNNEEVKGCNAYFIETTMQNDEYGNGFLPKKATLLHEKYSDLKELDFPIVANAVLQTTFTSKGVRTKVSDFEKIKKATIA